MNKIHFELMQVTLFIILKTNSQEKKLSNHHTNKTFKKN